MQGQGFRGLFGSVLFAIAIFPLIFELLDRRLHVRNVSRVFANLLEAMPCHCSIIEENWQKSRRRWLQLKPVPGRCRQLWPKSRAPNEANHQKTLGTIRSIILSMPPTP